MDLDFFNAGFGRAVLCSFEFSTSKVSEGLVFRTEAFPERVQDLSGHYLSGVFGNHSEHKETVPSQVVFGETFEVGAVMMDAVDGTQLLLNEAILHGPVDELNDPVDETADRD